MSCNFILLLHYISKAKYCTSYSTTLLYNRIRWWFKFYRQLPFQLPIIKWLLCNNTFSNDTLSFTSVHFSPSFNGQSHAQPGRGMFSSDHCGQVSGHLWKSGKASCRWSIYRCCSIYQCLKQPQRTQELYFSNTCSHFKYQIKQHYNTHCILKLVSIISLCLL